MIFSRFTFATASSKRLSSTFIVWLHSFIYMERSILSGIKAILVTILSIKEARLTGSSALSSMKRRVLKRMKSVWWLSIYSLYSLALCLRAKLSGSSPSGSNKTFTFIPSANNISIPRIDALIPALSPSYNTVILFVNLRIILICPGVSEVPDEATTFLTPLWCMEITSV